MKTIIFFTFIVALIIAPPASAEIYRFVDDEGKVYFTDDINQVPEDQRKAFETRVEYESESAAEDIYSDEETTEVSESDDFIDDNDPVYQSSYNDEPESAEDAQNDSRGEEDAARIQGQVANNDSWAKVDPEQEELDRIRQDLEARKSEIDEEYANLVQVKKKLTKERNNLTTRKDTLEYNAKVEDLNKRAEAYAKKVDRYKEMVKSYNDRIIERNAKLTKKN